MRNFLFVVSLSLLTLTSAFAAGNTRLICSQSNNSVLDMPLLQTHMQSAYRDGFTDASLPVISMSSQLKSGVASGANTVKNEYFYQSIICVTMTKPMKS